MALSQLDPQIIGAYTADDACSVFQRGSINVDANVYLGFSDYDTTGLLSNPNVTETTAADNGSSSAKWKDKTPQQILTDVNNALSAKGRAAGQKKYPRNCGDKQGLAAYPR